MAQNGNTLKNHKDKERLIGKQLKRLNRDQSYFEVPLKCMPIKSSHKRRGTRQARISFDYGSLSNKKILPWNVWWLCLHAGFGSRGGSCGAMAGCHYHFMPLCFRLTDHRLSEHSQNLSWNYLWVSECSNSARVLTVRLEGALSI